jgi:hypothetical protein
MWDQEVSHHLDRDFLHRGRHRKEKGVVSEKKERTSAGRDPVGQKEALEALTKRKEIS